MSARGRGGALGLHLALVPLALLWLLPLWLMLTYATTSEADFFKPGVPLGLGTAFADNWAVLLKQTPFPRALMNSIGTAAIFTIVSIVLTSLAAMPLRGSVFLGAVPSSPSWSRL